MHFFITSLLQLLDRFGSLYGELARFVLRLLGYKPREKQPQLEGAPGPPQLEGAPPGQPPVGGAWGGAWGGGPPQGGAWGSGPPQAPPGASWDSMWGR